MQQPGHLAYGHAVALTNAIGEATRAEARAIARKPIVPVGPAAQTEVLWITVISVPV